MKKNIGIWVDTSQAFIINCTPADHSIKKIESHIDTRERIPGESKKYGRFGGQYLTYEKNRQNRRSEQTSAYVKNLLKEVASCDSLVVFGPAQMKKILEKEIKSNIQLSTKLAAVKNSTLLTENQMIAWVKEFFDHNLV